MIIVLMTMTMMTMMLTMLELSRYTSYRVGLRDHPPASDPAPGLAADHGYVHCEGGGGQAMPGGVHQVTPCSRGDPPGLEYLLPQPPLEVEGAAGGSWRGFEPGLLLVDGVDSSLRLVLTLRVDLEEVIGEEGKCYPVLLWLR